MNRLHPTFQFILTLSVVACTTEQDLGDRPMADGMISDDAGISLDAGGDADPDAIVSDDASLPEDAAVDMCGNDRLDANESDVDCGGDCEPCDVTLACNSDTDCISGSCMASICRNDRWERLANMPTPRERLAAVVGNNGWIYAFGGFNEPSGALRTAEAYDPSRDAWTALPSMPSARYGHSAVLGNDGLIYLIGSVFDDDASADGDSRTVLVFNPETQKYTTGPTMSFGRYNGTSTVTSDGTIYAIGGYNRDRNSYLDVVEVLEPNADAWTELPARLTNARTMHATAIDADDTIWVFGGNTTAVTASDSVESYKPGDSGWFTGTPMPSRRKFVASSQTLDGRVCVFGGMGPGAPPAPTNGRVECYNPKTDVWAIGNDMLVPTSLGAAVTLPDGRIVVVGGYVAGFGENHRDAVQAYLP